MAAAAVTAMYNQRLRGCLVAYLTADAATLAGIRLRAHETSFHKKLKYYVLNNFWKNDLRNHDIVFEAIKESHYLATFIGANAHLASNAACDLQEARPVGFGDIHTLMGK